MRFVATVAGLLMLGCVGTASAQTGETPPTISGAKTIAAADAKALIDKGAVVTDVRKKASYVEGRLPKAKSITSARREETKDFDPTVFGADKSAPIVVYGHGTDGWSAVSAVESAVKAGYTNVNWLRGGFAEWTKASLPVEN